MVLGQTLGGAVILCVAQNVFQNTLVSELASRAPQIDAGIVTTVGASRVSSALTVLLGADAANIVVLCYNLALRRVWLVTLVLACVSVLGAVGMEWRSVRTNKNDATLEQNGEVDV